MLGRGESCWLGIHIVRPGSGQKASYCAGRRPRTLRCCKENIDFGGVLRLSGSLLFSISKPVA